jgi:hypothetical protein
LPAITSSRVWLERTTRLFGVVLVRSLGDAVEIEFGGELHAGVAGPDHRADDRFDLFAQAAFIGELALVGAGAAGIVGAAVGEQPPGLVDHRHPLRLQSVDRRGDQIADGADLLRLKRAAHFQYN